MNVEKVLKKVDNLSRYEKDSLLSWGRQQVHAHLLEGEIEETSNVLNVVYDSGLEKK